MMLNVHRNHKAYYGRATVYDDDELMLNVLRCHLTY